MSHITVDFQQNAGKIKPMHAVNNGPSCALGQHTGGFSTPEKANGNLNEYRSAGIPFARTHDSSFFSRYGLEHTVDVHAIFPDFDADPEAPESYDFVCTDHYMDMIEAGGAKIFYRLGSRIEHEVKKYGTLPPKDFHKWAVICEHIIRHYTEGWANGSFRDIAYWEIWNEPDLDPDDATNKRTWGGTKAEFFEFYHIVATHLKACFPHLKIGGPAISGKKDWAEEFLAQLKAPLDFFSWHVYAHDIPKITTRAQIMRDLLDQYGFTETESILNEWNYSLGWNGNEITYSRLKAKEIKGAAFNLAAMSSCQNGSVDMMMYYDARPCAWNGLFDMTQLDKVTTTAYFSFPMFHALYELGQAVPIGDTTPNLYGCAARNDREAALLLTHFQDDDNAADILAALDLRGFGWESGVDVEILSLDETKGLVSVERLTVFGDRLLWERSLPNFSCYLIKLKKHQES